MMMMTKTMTTIPLTGRQTLKTINLLLLLVFHGNLVSKKMKTRNQNIHFEINQRKGGWLVCRRRNVTSNKITSAAIKLLPSSSNSNMNLISWLLWHLPMEESELLIVCVVNDQFSERIFWLQSYQSIENLKCRSEMSLFSSQKNSTRWYKKNKKQNLLMDQCLRHCAGINAVADTSIKPSLPC